MKTKLILITVFITALTLQNFSQVNLEWAATFSGSSQSDDIFVDNLGNVYISGEGFITIKYNSQGVQQWISTYENGGTVLDMAADNNGNVYVTGWGSIGFAADDFVTVKINTNGVQQWAVRFNGPANYYDRAYGVGVDAGGNVYVGGGATWGAPGSGFDVTIVKYDPNGIQLWAKNFNGPGGMDDAARRITVDAAGNVYATGYCFTSGTDYDYITVKYNTQGILQWSQRYTAPNSGVDEAWGIDVDGMGNVYVTGKSMAASFDIVTIKYNAQGVQQWAQRYDGPGQYWDEGWRVKADADGNVYVTGGGYGTGTSNLNFETLKYNSGGALQWSQIYNGPGNYIDFAQGLANDNFGNVYVTGQSSGNGSDRQFATIKYNSAGVQQWVQRYGQPGQLNGGTAVAVDADNNVYVTGGSTGFITLKYSQPLGITQVNNEIPAKYSLEQNYPNPFNPETRFKFSIRDAQSVKLVVYDALGREISTLVNQNLAPGTYEIEFSGENLNSGIYFYSLTAGGFSQTSKMMLVK
jgi:type IX secretion system substrate protein/beta-propeller repeat-containing protein